MDDFFYDMVSLAFLLSVDLSSRNSVSNKASIDNAFANDGAFNSLGNVTDFTKTVTAS